MSPFDTACTVQKPKPDSSFKYVCPHDGSSALYRSSVLAVVQWVCMYVYVGIANTGCVLTVVSEGGGVKPTVPTYGLL